MSDERDDSNAASESSADEDRQAILERRGRFIRAAMASLAGASIVAACGGEATEPADAGNPQPCLSPVAPQVDGSQGDAIPQACLSIAADSGTDGSDGASDGGPDSADAADAIPQPCLSPLPPDSGD